MRPTTRFALAAVAAAAATAISSPSFVVAQERRSEQKADTAASNPAIYEQIAKALNDIVDNDGAAGLLDRIDRDDHPRAEDALKKSDNAEFRDLVARFKKKWKDKYKEEYNPEQRIGAVDDNPVTRFEWQGGEYANVDFPARDGDNAFQVRMVKNPRNGEWRIQLNDQLTGDRLVKRLQYSLEDLIENDEWMRSSTEAYYSVNRRLIGVLDFDPQGKKKNNTDDDDRKAAKKRNNARDDARSNDRNNDRNR